METHNVGSDLSASGMDHQIPIHMLLMKEHTKYELIILTYRIAVLATGVVLIVLGYLLFANLVIDFDNAQNNYSALNKIAPGTVFAVAGLIFCISGITKLMPLPKFDRMDRATDEISLTGVEVPTLFPITTPRLSGKLWENNVKPILVKVSNNETISRSDRALLRNWLQST